MDASPVQPNVASPVARILAILLLAGTVLLGVGAAVHPVLGGDATAQLRTIAETRHWRAIHLLMLAGTALVVAGVWARLVIGRTGTASTLVPALVLISLGSAINGLNTAYMTGAGWYMGDLFAAGRTEVIPIFAATHPIGLMAARFGNLLVALGALVLGWAERRDPGAPRWLAWLAWLAAAGGAVGVAFFDEGSRAVLAATALLSAWQVATGARVIRGEG